jgi:hypothetical protein
VMRLFVLEKWFLEDVRRRWRDVVHGSVYCRHKKTPAGAATGVRIGFKV